MAAPAGHEKSWFFEHDGPWTIQDLLSQPDDPGHRYELVDGMVFVSPNGTRRHQRLGRRVVRALEDAAPRGFEATDDINVALAEDQLLIPDFTVARDPESDALLTSAETLVLVGEVVSPSSRTHDRVFKRQLYADAGIPFYVLVDGQQSPAEIIAYELVQGKYREYARSDGGRVKLPLPFPVELDLSGC